MNILKWLDRSSGKDTCIIVDGVSINARKCIMPKFAYSIPKLINSVKKITGFSSVGSLTIEIMLTRDKRSPCAWYETLCNTIYVYVDYCKPNIIAHELTHCMFYNAFKQQLPKECSEVIPKWVDTNMQNLL